MTEFDQLTSAPPAAPTPGQALAKPHRGALVLALGIIGIAVCFISGIIAWLMGRNDLRAMDAGEMDPAGRGLTNAGRICGMIGTIWGCLWFFFLLVSLVLSLLLFTCRHQRVERSCICEPTPMRQVPIPVPPSMENLSDLQGDLGLPTAPESEQ